MVDALHAAGIELWLDVVYNHTAEGDSPGPLTACAASTTTPTTSSALTGSYVNDSGCGNTTQSARPGRARADRSPACEYWAEPWASTGSASTLRRS